MNIRIIVIGDEILNGQVTDTNTGSIARALGACGARVTVSETVGDDAAQISDAVGRALADSSCSMVVTTGGLGPTKDDITKNTLCELTGSHLVADSAMLENAHRIMTSRGLAMNALTETQALVPDTCAPIVNRLGTAPAMWFETAGKVICSLPGVPFETQALLDDEIVPRFKERFSPDVHFTRRTLLTIGIPESDVAERLADWEAALPKGFHLAYLPNIGYLRLRIDGSGSDAEAVEATADRLHAELREALSDHFFHDADMTPAEILLDLLKESGLMFATAESCTGGSVAATMTAIPGSSEAVRGGVVAYCNSVKHNTLGVGSDILESLGAVSEPVAAAMAEGAARLLGADVAVATSGIAGPGGAVPGKPVGTVCSAVTVGGRTSTFTDHFPGNRQRVVARSVNAVLIRAILMVREFRSSVRNC